MVPGHVHGGLTTLADVPSNPARTRRARPAADLRPGTGSFEGVRLHVVTGKGGTGKTTVAAALALALAEEGKKILLVEVEDRQGIAQMFDVPPLPYQERSVAVGPWGGEVVALAVEARAALLEYLDVFYKLGRAGKVLEKTGAIDFATTIAPGLRDVLLTGKVYEANRRTHKGSRHHVYDAVVLDAPPTGRITRFLNVNSEVSGLAKMGPIRNQADAVMRMMRSATTVVHLVTLLEEMPVQETLDGIRDLERVDLPVGAVVVNQVRDEVLPTRSLAAVDKGRLGPEGIVEGLVATGVAKDAARATTMATGLLAEAGEHSRRVALQRRERSALDAAGHQVHELAYLAGGVDLGGLYELAAQMRTQGLA